MSTTNIPRAALILVLCGFFTSCSSDKVSSSAHEQVHDQKSKPLLRILEPEASGINFRLADIDDREINYFKYTYIYNNGGVAIGDLNGDDLPDLVFSSCRQGCRVYQNQGGLKFSDISKESGVDVGKSWITSATLVDIDSDGDLDIYFCASGPYKDESLLPNKLYINDGAGKFEERASQFGLDYSGTSQSALFADVDNDEDLDLILLAHRTDFERAALVVTDPRFVPYDDETDRLFVNDGQNFFTDVTSDSNFRNKGFSLSGGLTDFNQDGLIDMYEANDFTDPDRLYINHGDHVFRNELKQHLNHCSYYSMGMDLADINNDAMVDAIVVDMTPSDHKLSKENMASMRPDQVMRMLDFGYPFQTMTNTLQLAVGNGQFIDIGHLSGVDRTDWSWSPLLFDVDNDGYKDLFISNGIPKDVSNSDYKTWNDSVVAAGLLKQISYKTALSKMPSHVPNNRIFRNTGSLKFEAAETLWDYQHKAITTGAAYGDLDNDGDLDLVTVDHNAPSRIVENLRNEFEDNHYLQFTLEGSDLNPAAIGSSVRIFTPEGTQYIEHFTVRGFQSCSEPLIHFGLKNTQVDSARIEWPDGSITMIHDIQADQRMNVAMKDSDRSPGSPFPFREHQLLSEIGEILPFVHKENDFNDFATEILLPHKQSEHGPAAAVADVNQDGYEDVLFTGSHGNPARLCLGTANGRFQQAPSQPWTAYKESEFIGACFFDADQDGDKDLYLAAGSTELPIGAVEYQDRLFLNDGTGKFSDRSNWIPELLTSTQVIVPIDVDGDQDVDLFVGGRNVPQAYPSSPNSYILINDGSGKFSDKSANWLGDDRLGMITTCLTHDFDSDGLEDLILAGEWTNIQVLKNTGSGFSSEHDIPTPDPEMMGWWYRLALDDLDNDGDIDIIAGNLGLNNKFHPRRDKPLKVYLGDMDRSGTKDIVLAKTTKSGELPVRGRECSSEQMPFVKERFKTFQEFAAADLSTLYGEMLDHSLQLHANDFHTAVFENDDNQFVSVPIPIEAQIGPTRGIIIHDVDADGNKDLILAGNLHGTEVETTPYDAGIGVVLLGSGDMSFRHAPFTESGFFAHGDVRDLLRLKIGGQDAILVINNDGPPQVFSPVNGIRNGSISMR
jgi:hypothetical protein